MLRALVVLMVEMLPEGRLPVICCWRKGIAEAAVVLRTRVKSPDLGFGLPAGVAALLLMYSFAPLSQQQP